MTAPARPQHYTDAAADNVAADRAAVTALVGSYRDTLDRGLDPLTALACVAGAAYQEMCSRRATRVIAAAVQIIAEAQAAADELRDSRESGNNLLANAEYHLTAARAEADALRAELEQLRAVPGVAALTAPLCPCRPNEAALHMKDCPVWVNVGPSLAQRQYVRRDSLTAEQADRAGVDRHWGPLAASTGGDQR